MQIVIDICKDDFDEICMQARMVEDTESLFGRIRKSIFHGTPLPRHGDLIDKNHVNTLINSAWVANPERVKPILGTIIKMVPTVLEAESEEV